MNCIGPIARTVSGSPSIPPAALSMMRMVPLVPSSTTPLIGGRTSPLGNSVAWWYVP